jgi:hypothetical protein
MLAVWNRACEYAGTGVGDRHLSALILVDGMVHNGGPNHAADGCEPAELAAAAAAARYFGVEDLAAVIEELPAAASGYEEEDIEMRLTRKYHEVLQDYGPLEAGIAARYVATPQDFDPLR